MADGVFIRRSFSSELVSYREYRLRTFLCFALVAVAVILLTVSTVYVFLNYSSTYPGEIELGKGDFRALEASSLFCEGISLTKASSSSKLYILPKLEILSGFVKRNYSSRVFVRRTKYWVRSHYLLEGSVVEVEIRSSYNIKINIIQSRDEFNEWIRSFATEDKEWQSSESSTHQSHSFPVKKSDNYYFIFTSHTTKAEYSGISINFLIKRKVYDLRNPMNVCNFGLKQLCSEKLDFASDSSAVLLLDDRSTSPNISFIQWECSPRIWFYVALFGGVFIISTALFVLGYICLNRHMKQKVTMGTDPDIVTNNSLRRQQHMEESTNAMVSEQIPLSPITGSGNSENLPEEGEVSTQNGQATEDSPSLTPVQKGRVTRKLIIPYRQPPPYDNRASAIEYEGELQMNSSAKSAVRRNASFTTFTQNDVREAEILRERSDRGPRESGDGTEDNDDPSNNRSSDETQGQDLLPEEYRFSLVTEL